VFGKDSETKLTGSPFGVGIVGCGYVGLVTGACLAHLGRRVVCVDKDEGKIAGLRGGRLPIYEPGLQELVERGLRQNRLGFSSELSGAVDEAEVLFIAVDTRQNGDGSADLSSVAAVARGIGRALAEANRERPLVVVNKSTVPVGSGDYVSMLIRDGIEEAGGPSSQGVDFLVVSNPEFLREGSAIYDSLYPDRIVAGAGSSEALDTLRTLYGPIIEQSFPTELDPRPKVAVPFVTTDLASAEMIKYAANAFLATKVSFINEISDLCELVGADVSEVAYGIGLDERIGARFLRAGIGWGGSCLPKDVSALRAAAREYEHGTSLLDATVAVNDRRRRRVIEKLQHDLHTLKGKRVALLGLAFKPNTDDLREAPSLEIASALDSLGARTVGYDPVAGEAAAKKLPSLKVVFDPYEALEGAHAAVILTEWEEVRSFDLGRVSALMRSPKLLVDGRNVLEPREVRAAGMRYRGFGRGYGRGQGRSQAEASAAGHGMNGLPWKPPLGVPAVHEGMR
jgi:UDPglucose 6-dehydrogenase